MHFGYYRYKVVIHYFVSNAYPTTNAFVFAHSNDSLLIIICQSIGCKDILLFVDVVCFNNGGEYREAILCAQRCIKVVSVDTDNFLSYPR